MGSIDHKKSIQQYYSARAKNYDRQKSRTWVSSQGFGDHVLNELLEALPGFENKSVLEVGVGTGRNAVPMLESVAPRFVGLDVTKAMLTLAKKKTLPYEQNVDLILGDAEYLPFKDNTFGAIVCMSTMHYFESQDEILESFSKVLKKRGTLFHGDLSVHESDDQRFFESLERTISMAHSKYHRPSETKHLLETHGFEVIHMKTVAYQKAYNSLIEDKAVYFDVEPKVLHEFLCRADKDAKDQYALTDKGLTLYYTVINAMKKT